MSDLNYLPLSKVFVKAVLDNEPSAMCTISSSSGLTNKSQVVNFQLEIIFHKTK